MTSMLSEAYVGGIKTACVKLAVSWERVERHLQNAYDQGIDPERLQKTLARMQGTDPKQMFIRSQLDTGMPMADRVKNVELAKQQWPAQPAPRGAPPSHPWLTGATEAHVPPAVAHAAEAAAHVPVAPVAAALEHGAEAAASKGLFGAELGKSLSGLGAGLGKAIKTPLGMGAAGLGAFGLGYGAKKLLSSDSEEPKAQGRGKSKFEMRWQRE